MVLQGLILSILCGSNQIPDKTLDLLISLIMFDTVDQERPTNHFHILLIEMPFKPAMSQDVFPTAPT